jgi:hypothetical protein
MLGLRLAYDAVRIEARLEVIKLLVRKGALLTATQPGYRPGSPLAAAKDYALVVEHGYNPSEEDRQHSLEKMKRIVALLEDL